MEDRKSYPTDLTDEQWNLIVHLLPTEKPAGTRGRKRIYSNRELVNGILYHLRVGGAWRTLPHDLSHWNSLYAYFRRWSEDGTLDRLQEDLRTQVRRQAGKEPTPSVVILDSETIKTTDKGGHQSRRTSVMTPTRRSKGANVISR
jgi:putative transposase